MIQTGGQLVAARTGDGDHPSVGQCGERVPARRATREAGAAHRACPTSARERADKSGAIRTSR